MELLGTAMDFVSNYTVSIIDSIARARGWNKCLCCLCPYHCELTILAEVEVDMVLAHIVCFRLFCIEQSQIGLRINKKEKKMIDTRPCRAVLKTICNLLPYFS